jgi:hypothetical protein
MAEHQLPKLTVRVRFPSSALEIVPLHAEIIRRGHSGLLSQTPSIRPGAVSTYLQAVSPPTIGLGVDAHIAKILRITPERKHHVCFHAQIHWLPPARG